MSSSRKALIEFINKYRECECLWKVTDIDYRNRHKRFKAMEQLVPLLEKTDVNANIATVTKKINTLRSCFKKENNKVKASLRSGAGIHDVHVPKLWYYDLLLFLSDRDTESRRSSDIGAILAETTADTPEGMDTCTGTEQDSPDYSQSSARSSDSQQNTQDMANNLKRKRINRATDVLAKISSRLDSSVSKAKPKFGAYGEHIAEKLRTMPNDMALYCQKIINDAIFQAEFDALNYTSRIVTEYPQHFQPLHRPSTTTTLIKLPPQLSPST